ncbi:MAG: hypothetical protein A4E65_03034 [Syntrophorhabdus sp. PtaU1.Bin153]|nr:MAG: hypothetical protein A4E65_03034 [Syntrophorhabdus sp. PtaU1.Bin153]
MVKTSDKHRGGETLSEIIPAEKRNLLSCVYRTIEKYERESKDRELSDKVKIQYTDDRGIKNTVVLNRLFHQKDADLIQKTFDDLHSLKMNNLLRNDEKLDDFRSEIIVASMNKQMQSDALERLVKPKGRHGNFAPSVCLFLLESYARHYDGKPHYKEVAEFINKEASADIYDYRNAQDAFRKIDIEKMTEKYWAFCRLACGTEDAIKKGDTYYYLSELPDWDSLYPVTDASPCYLIEAHKFVLKLFWGKIPQIPGKTLP